MPAIGLGFISEAHLAVTRANWYIVEDARRKDSFDMQVVMGSVAGKTGTVNMNQCDLDANELNFPDTGIVRHTFGGVARGAGTGENEFELALT